MLAGLGGVDGKSSGYLSCCELTRASLRSPQRQKVPIQRGRKQMGVRGQEGWGLGGVAAQTHACSEVGCGAGCIALNVLKADLYTLNGPTLCHPECISFGSAAPPRPSFPSHLMSCSECSCICPQTCSASYACWCNSATEILQEPTVPAPPRIRDVSVATKQLSNDTRGI